MSKAHPYVDTSWVAVSPFADETSFLEGVLEASSFTNMSGTWHPLSRLPYRNAWDVSALVTGRMNQAAAERWAAAKLSSSQIPTQGSDKMLVVELPEPKLGSLSSSATLVQGVPPSAETLSAVIANKPLPVMSGPLVVPSTWGAKIRLGPVVREP